jgi:hypothetical protein
LRGGGEGDLPGEDLHFKGRIGDHFRSEGFFIFYYVFLLGRKKRHHDIRYFFKSRSRHLLSWSR